MTAVELGIEHRRLLASAAAGIALGVLIAAPVWVSLAVPGLLPDVAVPRLAGVGDGEFLYRVLVRIPLGTAFFEEVLFRGVLYGLITRYWGYRAALVWSSAAFGLWHVRPNWDLVAAANLPQEPMLLWVLVAGGVVVTAVGGLLFGFLRHHTGHVAGPVVAHTLINSLSATGVYLLG